MIGKNVYTRFDGDEICRKRFGNEIIDYWFKDRFAERS